MKFSSNAFASHLSLKQSISWHARLPPQVALRSNFKLYVFGGTSTGVGWHVNNLGVWKYRLQTFMQLTILTGVSIENF